VEQGRLRPEIQEVFPLERVQQAHDLSETLRVRGKLVLRID
jgi:NADPH:quinone reductase-like Zn-dependent oxidoreductase